MERAIRFAGSGAALARLIGVSTVMVHKWRNGARITPERARQIEQATNGAVRRHELRPDVFDAPTGPRPEEVAQA